VAWVVREAASLRGKRVLLNMSGRGDKDLEIPEVEAIHGGAADQRGEDAGEGRR